MLCGIGLVDLPRSVLRIEKRLAGNAGLYCSAKGCIKIVSVQIYKIVTAELLCALGCIYVCMQRAMNLMLYDYPHEDEITLVVSVDFL